MLSMSAEMRCSSDTISTATSSICAGVITKARSGRPSITPGTYFRALLLGYFEGIDSERGIAWRLADWPLLRKSMGYELTEETPDDSTLSRTRRLYWLETHKAVFRWVLKILAEEGPIEGKNGNAA
jgi:transposase